MNPNLNPNGFGFWLDVLHFTFIDYILMCHVWLSTSWLCLFPACVFKPEFSLHSLLVHLCPLCLLSSGACYSAFMCPLWHCFVLCGFWFVLNFVFHLNFFPETFLCLPFVTYIKHYWFWAFNSCLQSLLFSIFLPLCVLHFLFYSFDKLLSWTNSNITISLSNKDGVWVE